MSGPEHLPPDDRELEEFLAGQGPQLARYRAASRECPPSALDARVLAQARAALPPRRGVWQAWRLPLSLAATLVLGFGLVSRVQREPQPPPAAAPAPQADAVGPALLASGSSAPPLVEPQAAAAARHAEAERRLAGAGRRDRETARAQAALSANQAALAAARERAAESTAVQAAAGAVPPAVVAQTEPAPTPPPPSPPPSPPPAPILMAPAPAAPGPAASVADADTAVAAVPAMPAAALQARGPVAAKTTPRSTLREAVDAGAETAWRYRDDRGRVLDLPPGRYRLRAASGEWLASGERRRIEGDREQLLGLGGEGDCRLWLEPLDAEAGQRLLAGDCESGFKGEYRRLEPER